ncbi:armadillo-type protein, partial [Tribonema minus]
QSTQAPTNEIRKEAEASLRACEASAGFSDALLAIVSSDAPSAVRLVAVILLKGLVRGSWKATRGAAARVLSSEEKQRVREFLLGPVPRQEGDNGVAVQLAVLSSKVARHDWPREWPDLFPALLNIVLTPRPPDGGLEQRRALFVIHHVLKELETKR